ncbi:hypothetical protein Kpol_1050p43 [Vanderwaltozyma polyspora DSM 70294]|uniref:phosphoserine phosphatase n=1 Tax=Vanderwaltozyma polyspora (strain ATCC 22028 / DSM 70294 / BCRC 21397 / CBS 2163 / NBRC 10782 / NRRL Y-8283 / UCD 57-17) TaxID=436907 RepID=A7TEU0_VANPO|nr:uncharacterized protein Kpol_1050p43 [Vanderwaltozyma polyspora DSM 70294]EDO19186.1 hypothetical protein Kpol_1050p43 [Vanderwaltozyma polyspora DSM 70294]
MVEYVITYIAHGDELKDSEVKGLTSDIESRLKVAPVKSRRLGLRAYDVYFELSTDDLKPLLADIIDSAQGIDVIVQTDGTNRQDKKLIVFDMDSTLIYQEVIEMIASYADVEDKVRDITNLAMNNEIDFKESLRQRVKLLEGLQMDSLYDEIKSKLLITNGVPEFCSFMKKTQGTKLCVLSGGFIQFAEFIKGELEFDYARANLLALDDNGRLTGETIGDIVDGQCKAETLLQLCQDYDIDVASSVMIGDGGNDLLAMAAAGFGIAWNAKPTVQKKAPCKLNTKSMKDVLYIFGYSDEEIKILFP